MANINYEEVPLEEIEKIQRGEESDYLDDPDAVLEARELLDQDWNPEDVREFMKYNSRDNSRIPRWWPDGFTEGEPWLKAPEIETSEDIRKNVEGFYKDLVDLRNSRDVITQGEFIPLYEFDPNAPGDDRNIMSWAFEGEDESLAVVLNMSDQENTFWSEVELENTDSIEIENNLGPATGEINTNELSMDPYEAKVISIDGSLQYR